MRRPCPVWARRVFELEAASSPASFLVALVGNPNAGKTTVFNALTGRRHHVANFPGVTVEGRSGSLRNAPKSTAVEVLDLPGAYSLNPRSADEAIVVQVLLGQVPGQRPPDLIVSIVDATNLPRHLFLTTQLRELGLPMIVALNMTDLARRDGMEIDARRLAERLGVPVVPVVATTREGLDRLTQEILDSLRKSALSPATILPEAVESEISRLAGLFEKEFNGSRVQVRTILAQTLLGPGGFHEHRLREELGPRLEENLRESRGRLAAADPSFAEIEARSRYAWIASALDGVVRVSGSPRKSTTERVDRLLTHPAGGLVVLLLLLGACFQAIYSWAAPLMDFIDGGFGSLGQWLGQWLPEGPVQSLMVDGVVAGVGAVLTFLPQILILFLFIGIVEDCGYLARAVFLLDRWMRVFGLSGKAVLPLISSFACAVPAIMATRVIEERRDRFLTILIAPLMSCSARLPVYTLMIAAFVPAAYVLGGAVSVQAVTLLSMYVVGIAAAIPVAWLARKTILKGESQPLLIELPSYRWPSPGTVFFRVYEQGREFCVTAGTMIFAVTIIIWALGYYPRSKEVLASYESARRDARRLFIESVHPLASQLPELNESGDPPDSGELTEILAGFNTVEERFAESVESQDIQPDSAEWATLQQMKNAELHRLAALAGEKGPVALKYYEAWHDFRDQLDRLDREESGELLRRSWLGRMGSFIEPAVVPLGWDWRIGTAVIASFPAREVVIATMGTIYNLGGDTDESSTGLRHAVASATWPDGRRVFNLAVALSIMIFFALCCQCAATLAVIKRETRSWRWPLLTFVYMTGLAYLAALLTYRVTLWLT